VVERKQVEIGWISGGDGLGERDPKPRSAALRGPALAGVVHENAPHRLGGDGIEVRPVRAFASICRMRSRVTWKLRPTSSSVCSEPSPMPKRILMMRSD